MISARGTRKIFLINNNNIIIYCIGEYIFDHSVLINLSFISKVREKQLLYKNNIFCKIGSYMGFCETSKQHMINTF